MRLFTLLGALCLGTALPHGKPVSNPMVKSRHGWLEGLQLTVKGSSRVINAFLGIPFAKPPIGSRRFSSPEPAEPWNNVRNATSYPPMCLQEVEMTKRLQAIIKAEFPPLSVSEDCLYLNVYSPTDADKNSKLPVMVWIHGGGLAVGAASLIQGSALSAYENVIVVFIQYRLGILGFLSTGDEHARGNWGFLDQVAALEWVKESIEDFGGDPASVTIFGESAGGMSTSAHVLSPLSRGLFHKAISESGVLVYPGLVTADLQVAANIAKMLANISGCETTDSPAIVACLKKKPEAHFLKPELIQRMYYVPGVVDGHFLLKSPEQLLAGKEINAVPYLIGCNNHEFGWIMPTLFNMTDLLNGMDNKTVETPKKLLRMILGSLTAFEHPIIEEYLGDAKDHFQIRDNYLELFGDIMIVIQSVVRARYHQAAGLPVYLYEFQHRASRFRDFRPDYVKADHTDELPFVFGSPFMDDYHSIHGNFTEEEETLSKTMMKYWANFARNGNPNGLGLLEWPPFGLDEAYLELNLQPKVARKLKDHRITFWTETLPKKMEEVRRKPTGL